MDPSRRVKDAGLAAATAILERVAGEGRSDLTAAEVASLLAGLGIGYLAGKASPAVVNRLLKQELEKAP